jgi:DMSO/TMAO reductase YedYZ molybdopterin-dependent catalytic subunit
MSKPRRLSALPAHPLPRDLPGSADWRLRVDGLVQRPLSLGLAQIASLAPAGVAADFACEEGWGVPDLRWEGVPVATVLAQAQPRPEARWLRIGAGDFTVALPLAEALGGALLAYRINGAPLTPEHGAPLRLVAPGRECYFSVKWVDRLTLLAEGTATTGEAIARARIGARG